MRRDTARFNVARATFERALAGAGEPWLWPARVSALARGDGSAARWFVAHACPLTVMEVERGTSFHVDDHAAEPRKRRRRGKRTRGCASRPANVRDMPSLLHGFYPPDERRDAAPVLVPRDGPPAEAPGTEWPRTHRARLFLLLNVLRWVEKQPPLVRPHRVVALRPDEGGPALAWASDAITKRHELVAGYTETDIEGRAATMEDPAEHAWFLAQQMAYVQTQLERAVQHWRTEVTAVFEEWRARARKIAAFAQTRTNGAARNGDAELLGKYVRYLGTQLAAPLPLDRWVHWMVHCGFMAREPDLARHLPMAYLNEVEGLYYDNGSKSD
jgi:hypothetical protein